MILDDHDQSIDYEALHMTRGKLPTTNSFSPILGDGRLRSKRPVSFADYPTSSDSPSTPISDSNISSRNNLYYSDPASRIRYQSPQKSMYSTSSSSTRSFTPASSRNPPASNSVHSQPHTNMPLQRHETVAGLNRKSSFPSDESSKIGRSASVRVARSSSRGFFSRFRRNSITSNDEEVEENEQFKTREEGWNAGVFGSASSFTSVPKYIWVHAHKKRNREFTRMFLAQELGETSDKSFRFSRQRSSSTDSRSRTRSESADPVDRKKAIWCAKFSPDGQFLATAGADCVIRIWKVLSDIHERDAFDIGDFSDEDLDPAHPTPHPNAQMPYNSSLSQQSLVSRTYRKGSLRRNARTTKKQKVSAPVFLPKPVLEYFGHTQDILDICWSKNNFLLSSSMDKTVKLWHPKLPQSIKTFVHNDFVTSIAFHPQDDRFFLSGSLDCRVRLWSITENKVEYHRDAPDFVMSVAFSPDGDTAVVGCFGGQCIFYETTNLRQKSQITVKSTHGKNSNGSRITGIQIMEMPTRLSVRNQIPEIDDDNESSSYRKNVKMLVSTSDSRIRMYNFEDKTLETKYKGHTTFQGQIHSSFSDNGEYIISGSEDQKTYIWRSNKEPGSSTKSRESYEYFHSNRAIVSVALFAPLASRSLLYNSRDPIYDLAAPPSVILTPSTSNEGNKSGNMSRRRTMVDFIGPNPSDGNIIITCDQDGIIKVFRQDSAYDKRKLISDSGRKKK